MVSKKYTYGSAIRIGRFLSLLNSVFLIIVGLFFLYGFIMSLLGIGEIQPSDASTLFWYFVGFSIWLPFVFIYIAYMKVDIEVEDGGLRIFFLLKSLFINWDDIEDFKLGKTLGLLNLKKIRILVTKNTLTPFHRLYGLMYGGTSSPSLLIGTDISNHEELFRIIKNNRKKNVHKG